VFEKFLKGTIKHFNSEIAALNHVLKDFHASEVPFVTLPKPQYFTLDYRVDFLKSNLL
jgi:hypothetical protein